ncbi:MAG: DUF4381 domain-containing protein [Luteibacter sp.]
MMPDQGPQLRDIHVPHVSMWWPLAPGWWIAIALAVGGIVATFFVLRRRRAWKRYVDASLAELRLAVSRHAVDGDSGAFAGVASQLLRRVARQRDPRTVALRGAAWHDALAAMAPRRDVARLVTLDDAIYRRAIAVDAAAVAADLEAWVHDALPRQGGRRRDAA